MDATRRNGVGTGGAAGQSCAPGRALSSLAGSAVLFLLLGVLPTLAQAQIVFRGSSSASAPAAGTITFRAATSAVSGGITYRGAATTGLTSLAPVFRAAASASAANAVLSLTIAKPAGTVQDDVMVAAIGVSSNAPTITAPPGWILVRRMTNAAANANSLAVYIKVATAYEPLSYTWTFSASGGSSGGIQTFYNVDTTSPVDAEAGQTTVSGTSHATPGITTTIPNTMLVTAYTFSSSRSWNAAISPAVPTVTQRINVRSSGNNNAGQSTAAYQGVVAAAGLVPALTASTTTAAGSADVGNTHVLALRPALRVPRPALTAPGDFMIAAIGIQPSTATVTAPAGWTLVNRIDNAGPTSNSLVIYRKFAVADEPASYLWQVSGATAVVGGIQSFVGVNPATPVDAQAGQATASSLTHTAPVVTTTVANTMLVGHYTFASSTTWTPQNPPGPPVAMTESYDVASQAAGAAGQSLEGTRTVQASAGGSAAYASSALLNADAGATHMMALRPAGTQISIAKPAGVIENDVMIAAIGLTPSSVTITPPPGWTLIRRTTNAGGVSNALAIFSKVATNAEPAGYIWTFTGNASAVGGIQAFIGVDTATPVDAEGGQSTPSALTHTAPSITTTVANTMLVSHYTFSSARTWTPPPASGGDAAMTESFDVLFPPTGANGQSLEGARVTHAAIGATAAKTATASANADFGNTHILALRPQAGSSIDLPVPLGTVTNDVMIAAIGFQPNTLTLTAPAGWVLVRRIDNAAATANSLAVYQRVAGTAEPGAYQWTFGAGALTYAAGGIQTFSGVDTATPVDVENGAATVSALTHATPSITTTVANTMLVTAHTFASSATWTPPAGMTEAYDRPIPAAAGAAGQSIEGSFVAQVAAGATGAKTATASANADRGNTHILALRSAIVIVPPAKFNGCESATCTPAAAPLTYAALYTKLAGTAFNLYGVALKADGTLEAGFSGSVAVDLLANISAGVLLGANNCPASQDATIALGDATFTAGRATISSINVANAYRDARMRFTCTAAVCGSAITQCSSDNFAVRPSAFTVSSSANADASGASFAAAPAVRAGATFTLTATALASYNGTPAVDSTKLAAHTGAIQTGSLGGNFSAAAAATGAATGNFTYSEVGYFNFAANGVYDDAFTAVDQASDCTADFSNTLVGGRYGCKFGNTSATSYFGRFVPDHLALTAGSLIDRADINTGTSETCPSLFTYMGEDFRTTFKLAAQNSANATTQNYTGGHAKFGLTTWSNFAFTGSGGTLVQGGVAPTGAWGSTAGTYGTADITATHTVTRAAAPAGPYASFSVSALPSYTDGTATIALAASTAVHAGPSEQRYGRLKLSNANGSELLNLPIPIQTQYWNGTGFVTNAADNCTTLTTGNIKLTTTLTGVNATAGGAFSSGMGSLALTKPSPATNGTVDLCVDLDSGTTGDTTCQATTPAAQIYLQTGAAYNKDPVARATFGVYRGNNVFIYMREAY